MHTKIRMPPLRPDRVPRPRLLAQLEQSRRQGQQLTLISAPAGFGKTTLACQWMAGASGPVAWLSLDEADQEPARFLAYMIAALNHAPGLETAIGAPAQGLLQSPQPPAPAEVLTTLLNDIAALDTSLTLILDDYHLLQAAAVDDALSFLLDHAPQELHLILITREDPALPLARLRARGQLSELRAADLRFTAAETTRFLNDIMDLELSPADIVALDGRTEGWIVGLQLAALSLQGRDDAAAFIDAFTGSHRFVLDYLVEEVLQQQPAEVQSFLQQTAVLDRLTAPLCDAVTGLDNGQVMLHTLEHNNLFLVPLDEDRRWYRYQHLFADLLRQTPPPDVPRLHLRASAWYEENGMAGQAIDQALRAGAFERAAQLLQQEADRLWQDGDHVRLRRWLWQLPEERLLDTPRLMPFHAWYLFSSGQHEAAEKMVRLLEQRLAAGAEAAAGSDGQLLDQLPPAQVASLRGRIAAIRAFMHSYTGDAAGLIRYGRLALDCLPRQDGAWRTLTAVILGDAQGFLGNMEPAYEARYEALQACQAAGYCSFTMIAGMKLAITVREQGHLQDTSDLCRQQLALGEQCGLAQSGLSGLLLLIEAEVMAERNDLDGALAQARQGEKLLPNTVDLATRGWGYKNLIRILFSRGELEAATKIAVEMAQLGRETDMPAWIVDQIAGWQARLWLAQNKVGAAVRWAEERGHLEQGQVSLRPQIGYPLLIDYVILARVLRAQERLQETERLLARLLQVAQSGGQTARAIEILILQSLVWQDQDDRDRAMEAMQQALTLAEPGGFIRTFIDEGAPMAHLLQEAASRGIAPAYTRQLLAAMREPGPVAAPERDGRDGGAFVPLAEPLTLRELELLRLIEEGLSNPQIAAQLFLSLNTVKAHTRNIYGKLDVHSRTQAVSRARALELL